MKRSPQVTLTIVTAIGLAGCTRRYDPCDADRFAPAPCADAIRNGGYYWNGSWVPMHYSHAYPYYYDLYRQRVAGGGGGMPPAGPYGRPSGVGTAGAGDPFPAAAGVTRGGFGSTGAAHGAGE